MTLAEVLDQLKFLMKLTKDGAWKPSSKPMPKQDAPTQPNLPAVSKKHDTQPDMPAVKVPSKEPKKYSKPEKWISAGGVVVAGKDDYSKIYIRKPSNNYGPWSFPKGKVDKGESPPRAALREVFEEIGVKAELVPGGYLGTGEGGFSVTHFYLMYATRDTGKTDMETEKVSLVPWEEALHTFARAGNMRDLRITSRALDLVESLRKKGKVP